MVCSRWWFLAIRPQPTTAMRMLRWVMGSLCMPSHAVLVVRLFR